MGRAEVVSGVGAVRRGFLVACTVALGVVAISLLPASARAPRAKTSRASVNTAAEGNDESFTTEGAASSSSTSGDGRLVAFESKASNLVGGDKNGDRDIFVRDTRAGKTTRVSISSAGKEAKGNSFSPSISANGRYVAFHSAAPNLVRGDTKGVMDVFVYDRRAHRTQRVSVSSAGKQGDGGSFDASISANGRFVAFDSLASSLAGGDTNGAADVFVRDRKTGKTERVSVTSAGRQKGGASFYPSISSTGRFVAFTSEAKLVGDDSNGKEDIFVHDRVTGKTKRVSVSSAGDEGNDNSHAASISGDGRFVAFESDATNLIAGTTTHGFRDLFVHNRRTGTTKRLSIGLGGGEPDGYSFHPSISATGRFVTFESTATNLVPNDMNAAADIFVSERRSGATERVSVRSSGGEGNQNASSDGPSISANGRRVAFTSFATNLVSSDKNNFGDVFFHDRTNHTTRRVSLSAFGAEGDDRSLEPSTSAIGRFVAFYSFASNLVDDDTNQASDIFVRDRKKGRTQRVSLGDDGAQAEDFGDSAKPSISADGRLVAFESRASNLVAGDMGDHIDVFVRNRKTGSTELVSRSSAGVQGSSDSFTASISADGRFVAFQSSADNLVPMDGNLRDDVFVHDRKTGKTKRASVSSANVQGDGVSDSPSISGDGRFVAFASRADNLVANDGNHTSDVFVRDRKTGKTKRVSVTSSGAEGNGFSEFPSITGDGRFVAFDSGSSLVGGDSNMTGDVYVRDRKQGKTRRVSVSSSEGEAHGPSSLPSISADGRSIAFESLASDLVGGDTNSASDVFVRDRKTGKTRRISVSSAGMEGGLGLPSTNASISANGRFGAFESVATLVPNDSNNANDVFVRGPLR